MRVISIVTLLITPLITTHEPPSSRCFSEQGDAGILWVFLAFFGTLASPVVGHARSRGGS